MPPLQKVHTDPTIASSLLCRPNHSPIQPHHPDPKHSPSEKPTVVARCTDLSTTGRLWDVYRAGITLTDRPSEKLDAILKITVPTLLPPQVTAVSEYHPLGMAELVQHTSETGEKAAWNEDYIFGVYLTRYQGNLVPKYYGSFVCYRRNQDQGEAERPYGIAQIQEYVGPRLRPARGTLHYQPRTVL
ncbi:hypothetical protein I302_101329 [Kwoniella bestiolae CBS 10118]|uniref:Uncharacterized protein n=1 Tax=Kwoniella bestiolae CBS 10118 TaxID=1296100 RepID=A0A1B9GBY1_9TREE|nr:hypothetical protein I302_00012 [Kwoniella bestiolae CBS 10118]OCF28525.1 hypothetical protein I302_00012 [Kwoniella bestiolae CBS 10118]